LVGKPLDSGRNERGDDPAGELDRVGGVGFRSSS